MRERAPCERASFLHLGGGRKVRPDSSVLMHDLGTSKQESSFDESISPPLLACNNPIHQRTHTISLSLSERDRERDVSVCVRVCFESMKGCVSIGHFVMLVLSLSLTLPLAGGVRWCGMHVHDPCKQTPDP
jgi:hypothetical protein